MVENHMREFWISARRDLKSLLEFWKGIIRLSKQRRYLPFDSDTSILYQNL